jgi:hypothetical protein
MYTVYTYLAVLRGFDRSREVVIGLGLDHPKSLRILGLLCKLLDCGHLPESSVRESLPLRQSTDRQTPSPLGSDKAFRAPIVVAQSKLPLADVSDLILTNS